MIRRFIFAGALLLIVVVGVGLFVRGRQGHAQPPISQPEQTRVVTIPVEGMVCLACTARVKCTLKTINGVAEVEVNLAGRDLRVEYLEGKVSPEQLASAINRLGYRAGAPRVEETR